MRVAEREQQLAFLRELITAIETTDVIVMDFQTKTYQTSSPIDSKDKPLEPLGHHFSHNETHGTSVAIHIMGDK